MITRIGWRKPSTTPTWFMFASRGLMMLSSLRPTAGKHTQLNKFFRWCTTPHWQNAYTLTTWINGTGKRHLEKTWTNFKKYSPKPNTTCAINNGSPRGRTGYKTQIMLLIFETPSKYGNDRKHESIHCRKNLHIKQGIGAFQQNLLRTTV